MINKIQERVQELHTFAIPTKFLEVGCGVTLSNLLFSENHASNTIYDVYSPYNRKAQEKISSQITNHRAVSIETTGILMESLFEGDVENVGYYVANFQIGGNPESPKTTHGYIGIAGPDRIVTYYHVTIPREDRRGWLLNQIAQVGFAIFYNKMLDIDSCTGLNFDPLQIDYVDP